MKNQKKRHQIPGCRSDSGDCTERCPSSPPNRVLILLRWVLLISAFVAFNILASRGLTGLIETRLADGLDQGAIIGLAALLLYAGLLAIPFVPGVEIGLTLLVMHGADVAPYVHIATVAGLTLSFLAGWAFATSLPCTFLRTMGLPRACAYVDRMKDMSQSDRLSLLEASVPSWLGQSLIRHRYLMLGILINLPGNSLIGGGGGIVLVAGLSRLFSFPAIVLTIALATAPVPLAVYLFGAEFLQ